jgi:alkylated DNA repair dioxygenase AlkB
MHSLDLFDSPHALQRLDVPDADLCFAHGFYPPDVSARLMAALMAEIPWRQERIPIAGALRWQPRLTSWHGEVGADYAYSGLRLDAHPWTPTLLRMRHDIEAATGHAFNSVLLNLYRDQHDSVGWHSDNEEELGAAPAIASLSLGETRLFRLRHRARLHPPLDIALTDGSLLLMAGETQRHWQHAVPKESRERGPRINLTFRRIAVRRAR